MPKTDASFNPGDYALVADRIALFYERYPNGRIIPRLHAVTDDAVIFEALIYRDKSDTEPAAVGWAREFEGDGDINEVACLENTETSAIGRALANLGFAASKKRPSYEEMMKADRARRRLGARIPPAPSMRAIPTAGRSDSPNNDELQAQANAAMDVVRLVRMAERLGLGAERANDLVARVSEAGVSDRSLTRLERVVTVISPMFSVLPCDRLSRRYEATSCQSAGCWETLQECDCNSGGSGIRLCMTAGRSAAAMSVLRL